MFNCRAISQTHPRDDVSVPLWVWVKLQTRCCSPELQEGAVAVSVLEELNYAWSDISVSLGTNHELWGTAGFLQLHEYQVLCVCAQVIWEKLLCWWRRGCLQRENQLLGPCGQGSPSSCSPDWARAGCFCSAGGMAAVCSNVGCWRNRRADVPRELLPVVLMEEPWTVSTGGVGPALGLLSVVGINSKVLTKSTALSPLVAIFTSLRERLIDSVVAKLSVLQNNIFLFVQSGICIVICLICHIFVCRSINTKGWIPVCDLAPEPWELLGHKCK